MMLDPKYNKKKTWIQAARPRTLPLAVSSILTGSAIAWTTAGDDRSMILIFALLTCVLLQVMSNFANDYGDYSHGTDNEQRIGPQRAVQSGIISKLEMFRAIVITGILALVSGILLLFFAFHSGGMTWKPILMFVLGLLAIAAAYKYTAGKNPYGYRGLGDISVFLFFGIIGVAGCYFLYTHKINAMILLPAAAIGLFSAAVLNLNNLRDHENDKASGKITLVVRLGYRRSKKYHAALLLAGWTCILVFLITAYEEPLKWITCLPLPVMVLHLIRVFRTENPGKLDPELKKVALSTFVFSLLLLLFAVISRTSVVTTG